MSEIVVESLTAADLALNLALSNRVGWPDTEAEWRVIYDAACVLGVRRAGALVGQGALGVFEGAGSIAKMVVAPSAQRQGIGGRILDGLLREAEQRALSAVGLVATPFGQPLYESRGFVATGEVVITVGTPQGAALHEAEALLETDVAPVQDAEQILRIERRFMSSSRAAILRGRLAHSCATAVYGDVGFALATWHEKGTRVGPIIAADEACARSLTVAILRAVKGPLRFDIPGEKADFRRWLVELGLVEKGVHMEMQRGGALPWCVPERFAQATQAWG